MGSDHGWVGQLTGGEAVLSLGTGLGSACTGLLDDEIYFRNRRTLLRSKSRIPLVLFAGYLRILSSFFGGSSLFGKPSRGRLIRFL